MRILAIETSCDETGIAILNFQGSLEEGFSFSIEANLLASQIETHRPYGGVVPGLARREHERNLPMLFRELEAKSFKLEPDIVAVTVGPGLSPCLWGGITFAEEIHGKHFSKAKLVGANHLEGHLYSFLLAENADVSVFPAIHLLVSGGHTMLILMRSLVDWDVLGETRDDAVGEAFDKVARLLELPYPGGPEIEKLAGKRMIGIRRKSFEFPAPMLHSGDYNLSYSGLKTAVLYYLRNNPRAKKPAVARAFQEAAFAPLVAKVKRATEEYGAKSIMLSGGVAANRVLQEKLRVLGHPFFVAPLKYNTDNAVIIALAASVNQISGKEYRLEAQPNLSL